MRGSEGHKIDMETYQTKHAPTRPNCPDKIDRSREALARFDTCEQLSIFDDRSAVFSAVDDVIARLKRVIQGRTTDGNLIIVVGVDNK